jgi:hypothetical protein
MDASVSAPQQTVSPINGRVSFSGIILKSIRAACRGIDYFKSYSYKAKSKGLQGNKDSGIVVALS